MSKPIGIKRSYPVGTLRKCIECEGLHDRIHPDEGVRAVVTNDGTIARVLGFRSMFCSELCEEAASVRYGLGGDD